MTQEVMEWGKVKRKTKDDHIYNNWIHVLGNITYVSHRLINKLKNIYILQSFVFVKHKSVSTKYTTWIDTALQYPSNDQGSEGKSMTTN